MQSWVQRCAAAGANVAATAAANSKAVSSEPLPESSPCPSGGRCPQRSCPPATFARFVDGPGGIPNRCGGPLGVSDHLGTLVLDGLELTDRTAELLADLGVGRRGVGGPARDADRLGRQQGGHQRTRQSPAQVAQHAIVTDLDGVGAHMRQRSQRVHAGDGLDLQLVGVEHHPLFAAVDGHRKHQHRRLGGRRDRANLAADHQVVALPGGRQSGIDGVRGDHVAGGQLSQQLGVRVMRRDQRARDRRRHERSGHCPVAELGEDDGQLENAETLSANGFGEVYALQALLGGGLPVRRWVGNGRFQRLVQDL